MAERTLCHLSGLGPLQPPVGVPGQSVATRSRDPPGQGGPVELRCRHSPVWPVLRTGGLGPWFVHARPAWRACLGSYGRDCLARVQHRGQLRSWPLPGGWSEKGWVGSGRRGAPSQGSTGPLAVGDSPLQSGEKTLSGLDGGPRSWGRWLAWACVTPTFWPNGLEHVWPTGSIHHENRTHVSEPI